MVVPMLVQLGGSSEEDPNSIQYIYKCVYLYMEFAPCSELLQNVEQKLSTQAGSIRNK